jgi:hypothetical protein
MVRIAWCSFPVYTEKTRHELSAFLFLYFFFTASFLEFFLSFFCAVLELFLDQELFAH